MRLKIKKNKIAVFGRSPINACILLRVVTSDKDGSHIIRSVIVENPTIHANFMALSFIDP